MQHGAHAKLTDHKITNDPKKFITDHAHFVAGNCSCDVAANAVSFLSWRDGDGSDADSVVKESHFLSSAATHATLLARRDAKRTMKMGIRSERSGEEVHYLDANLAMVWMVCRRHGIDHRAFLVSCSGEMTGVDSLAVTSGRSPS